MRVRDLLPRTVSPPFLLCHLRCIFPNLALKAFCFYPAMTSAGSNRSKRKERKGNTKHAKRSCRWQTVCPRRVQLKEPVKNLKRGVSARRTFLQTGVIGGAAAAIYPALGAARGVAAVDSSPNSDPPQVPAFELE